MYIKIKNETIDWAVKMLAKKHNLGVYEEHEKDKLITSFVNELLTQTKKEWDGPFVEEI